MITIDAQRLAEITGNAEASMRFLAAWGGQTIPFPNDKRQIVGVFAPVFGPNAAQALADLTAGNTVKLLGAGASVQRARSRPQRTSPPKLSDAQKAHVTFRDEARGFRYGEPNGPDTVAPMPDLPWFQARLANMMALRDEGKFRANAADWLVLGTVRWQDELDENTIESCEVQVSGALDRFRAAWNLAYSSYQYAMVNGRRVRGEYLGRQVARGVREDREYDSLPELVRAIEWESRLDFTPRDQNGVPQRPDEPDSIAESGMTYIWRPDERRQ